MLIVIVRGTNERCMFERTRVFMCRPKLVYYDMGVSTDGPPNLKRVYRLHDTVTCIGPTGEGGNELRLTFSTLNGETVVKLRAADREDCTKWAATIRRVMPSKGAREEATRLRCGSDSFLFQRLDESTESMLTSLLVDSSARRQNSKDKRTQPHGNGRT